MHASLLLLAIQSCAHPRITHHCSRLHLVPVFRPKGTVLIAYLRGAGASCLELCDPSASMVMPFLTRFLILILEHFHVSLSFMLSPHAPPLNAEMLERLKVIKLCLPNKQ